MGLSPHVTLGLHVGHDRAVTVLADGMLIGHLSEERVDRQKHSFSTKLPMRALQVLQAHGLFHPKYVREIGVSFDSVESHRLADRWKSELEEAIGPVDANVIPVSHHLAHAYAAFYTSPFRQALVLVADGGGDLVLHGMEAETLYRAEGGAVEMLEQRLQFPPSSNMGHPTTHAFDALNSLDRDKPISLGRKYTQITYTIGFGVGQEGKTMGLAPYGRPLFRASVSTAALSFSLSFGTLLEEIEHAWRNSDEAFGPFLRRHRADMAASVQALIEEIVLKSVTDAVNRYGITDLCLGGGLFLNCLLNHQILESTPVRRLHVVPAAGDDGQSIGAALHAYHAAGRQPPVNAQAIPYLGPNYSPEEIEGALIRARLPFRCLEESDLAPLLAERIAQGALVGLLRGRTEIGPRALCHRSILGDPRNLDTKARLDLEVKHREAFRPYAPVVTAEAQFRIFELRQSSPFMLLAAPVRPEYRPLLPAVTHVDGTARIQAVSAAEEPFVHRLLLAFEERTGVPVLLNTSFNDAGEPVVETPDDAIATFLSTGLDLLVLENYLVEKQP